MADNNEFYRLNLVLKMEDRLSSAMSKVDGTVGKFEKNLQKTQKTLEKLGGTQAEPKVNVDTSKAEAQLEKTNKLLEQISKKIAKPKVDAEDKTAPRVASIQSRLQKLTSRAWKVTVGVKDEISGKLSGMKNMLSSPMGIIGMGAATMGVGALVADSANEAMNFSAEISNIKALTQLPQDQIDRIRSKAMQLGKDTQFSTLQAAQGMTELLKAGVSVEDVMGGASQAMLDLATAGSLELPEAAEIMSTAMNAFHMKDAAHAADILAGAANASATDVHELRYSLSMCSAVAAGVGMSFEDANTALAVFAQNGLKGSDAGTSLKTMMSRLEPMTKTQMGAFQQLGLITERGTSAFYDQEGKLRSLAEIADLLKTKLGGLTNEEQQRLLYEMFGPDAIRGGMILMREGAEGVKKMYSEMTHYTASDVAIEKMNNAKGAVERMKGSFENFQIEALAPMEPVIEKIAKSLDSLFDKDADGASNRVKEFANDILYFMECLENNEKFQNMDWGDKIVYVLDRMMEAIDKWASGPGGDQFGKVMTKLAEIGMKAFMTALLGLMKGSLNALFSGNITGALGLALGASMLGGGTLLGAAFKGIKGLGGLALGGNKGGIFGDAYSLARDSGSGRIGAGMEAGKFTLSTSPLAKALSGAAGFVERFGKRIAIVGAVLDGYRFFTSDDKVKTGAQIAGGWAGALAGAKLGAAGGGALGAWFGGVGAVPGAILGGLVGGVGGYFAGEKFGGSVVDATRNGYYAPGVDNQYQSMATMPAPSIDWGKYTNPNAPGVDNQYASMATMPAPSIDWSGMGAGIEKAIETVKGKISSGLESLGTGFENAKNNISEVIGTIFSEESFSQASASITNLATEVETGASNIYSSLTSWVRSAISYAGGQFDALVARVRGAMASAKQAIWDATPAPIQGAINFGVKLLGGHADGGIFNQEHIARFAEGGKAEAVVPLDASMRTQGLSIWQQAGQMLGINADLFANALAGGSYQPAYTAAAAGSAGGDSSSSNAFSFPGMNIHIGNNKSQDEMAMEIGRRILAEIEQSFENRE